MDLIGRPYDADNWNCATLLAQLVGFQHEPGAEWSRQFTAALRRHGKPLQEPQNGAVIVVTNPDGSLHVGRVDGAFVLHSDELGGTCRTPLISLRKRAKRVRFYEWRG